MIIVSYPNVRSFLAVMQETLEENETANSLMLGVLLRLQEKEFTKENQPFLRTTHDHKGLLTAAVFTPPNRPILLYNDRGSYQDSLNILASDVVQNNWQPSGVLATHEMAETFARLWSKASGLKSKLAVNERLYECTAVQHQGAAQGQLRVALPRDLTLLTEWSLAFTAECGLPETQEQVVNRLKTALEAKNVYVWEESTLPVSMLLKTRPTRHTISISGVYTPPSLRGRGFASAAVGTLTKQLLEHDYKVCNLFTDLSNPTSNAIYQHIGYVPVVDYNFYQFDKTSKNEE